MKKKKMEVNKKIFLFVLSLLTVSCSNHTKNIAPIFVFKKGNDLMLSIPSEYNISSLTISNSKNSKGSYYRFENKTNTPRIMSLDTLIYKKDTTNNVSFFESKDLSITVTLREKRKNIIVSYGLYSKNLTNDTTYFSDVYE